MSMLVTDEMNQVLRQATADMLRMHERIRQLSAERDESMAAVKTMMNTNEMCQARSDLIEAERDRLRAALEELADHHWSSDHTKWLARRALEGKK